MTDMGQISCLRSLVQSAGPTDCIRSRMDNWRASGSSWYSDGPCVLATSRVFATPRVFATSRVYAGAVFARCLRAHTCLRDATRLGHTYLFEVSALAHVSSLRQVSSPDLSSGSIYACPRVSATPRVFAGPVFAKCPRLPIRLCSSSCTWLHCGRRLGRRSVVR